MQECQLVSGHHSGHTEGVGVGVGVGFCKYRAHGLDALINILSCCAQLK